MIPKRFRATENQITAVLQERDHRIGATYMAKFHLLAMFVFHKRIFLIYLKYKLKIS